MLLLEITVTNVLGTTRRATRFYGDGSYDCPHCGYPIRADRNFQPCDNPWCIANPLMPVDSARKILADVAAKAEEERQRKFNHESAMRRIQEENERRADAYRAMWQLAKDEGYCFGCLSRSDGRRKVRHRDRTWDCRNR